MPPTVLIEGADLTLRQGTGIATYARNLAVAARSAGYRTAGLVNIRKPINRRKTETSDVVFADPQNDSWMRADRLRFARTHALGMPFGIRTYALPPCGPVADMMPSAFAGLDHLYAAVRFNDSTYHHFARYGQSAKLKVSETPALFHATQAMPLAVAGCPNIYTIHDLVPLRLPEATLDDKRHFLKLVRHLCSRADHIVTVSEHSRRDIIEICGISEDRITNTYQAVSLPQSALDASRGDNARLVRDAFGLEADDYYLFVGAIEPKKNLSRLIDAYATSSSNRPLIIVGGRGWQNEDVLAKIEDKRFAGDLSGQKVRRLSYLQQDQLYALISSARALLFPSLYEGFGLPVVEAMQLGTPVVTSNVSSLPEVAGDAALLVDPLDTNAIARAIVTLDADDDLRAELSRRGLRQADAFSAEKYAQRIAALYRSVLG